MKPIQKYPSIPEGFKRIKSGEIQAGDLVKYENAGIEDCAGLVGDTVQNLRHAEIYREQKQQKKRIQK